MSITKRTIIGIASLLTISFLLSGCHFFTEGKQKLNLYCPGLKVDINGVSWSGNGLRDVYVLNYDRIFQKQVQTYFAKKENGFTEQKDGDFYDIEIDSENVIDKSDNIVGKTIQKSKGRSEVVFDETTRRIIIIEYSEK